MQAPRASQLMLTLRSTRRLATLPKITLRLRKTCWASQTPSLFTATDGEAAFELVERESPDLIVSEVMLPKTDGFLFRQRLRENSRQQQIPFFILSFQKNEENVQRAFALEIEHYLQKPYMLSELTGLIQLKFRQLSVTTA